MKNCENMEVRWVPIGAHVGLDPLCGSSVTNLTRPAEGVVAFYNGTVARVGAGTSLTGRDLS